MSLTPLELDMATDQAIAAWLQARTLPPFTSTHAGFTLEDGYVVMQRLHQYRLQQRWLAVGRKIGFTNTTIWERYGVHHPIWGWVYDHTLLPHPASWDQGYECPLNSLVQPRIEPEIVVCFAKAPPVTDDLLEVWDSVSWIAHGFEIVQSHYPDWRFGAADSVAFGSLHGRLMVGPPVSPSALGRNPADVVRALGTLELTLQRQEGQALVEVDRGCGANVLGNPLAAISHLQMLLAKQGGKDLIQAGELVTTGTVTDAHPVHPGQTWCTRVVGIDLPGMKVRFTA